MSPSVLAQIRWASWCPKKEQLIKRSDFIFQCTLVFVFCLCFFVSFLGYVSGCFPSSYFQHLSNTVQLSSITQATFRQCGWCWHVLYCFALFFLQVCEGWHFFVTGSLIDGPSPTSVMSYFIILYHMVQDIILHHLVLMHHENVKINDSEYAPIVFGRLTMIMPYGFLVAKDLQISM